MRSPYQTFTAPTPMTQSNSNNNNGGTDQKLRLCGLWKNSSKDGKSYLSGTIGGVKVIIFPNGFKKSEDSKDPDFVAYLVPNQPKDKPAQQQQQPADEFGGF
jgi:hypothetical protein